MLKHVALILLCERTSVFFHSHVDGHLGFFVHNVTVFETSCWNL